VASDHRGDRRERGGSELSAPPVFYYDLSSPYAYLSAERIEALLPQAHWQPIAFGALLRTTGRVPWSLQPGLREEGIGIVEARAAERGLPPVRWPEGWPDRSYSLHAPRAALWATSQEERKRLSLALFRRAFVDGERLDDAEVVVACAADAGLDADSLREALATQELKDRLRRATDEAHAAGVNGIPTIAFEDELFWGDDRLDEAAQRT
jgi:2-hydroxychromene-2-carboxylate isomerase